MSSVSSLEFLSLSSPLRTTFTAFHHQLPCLLLSQAGPKTCRSCLSSVHHLGSRNPFTVAAGTTLTTNSVPVGLVSDYDLLALDSISGTARSDVAIFPEVDSTWKTFDEVQNLLSKTNGQVVGDLMTPAPLVVRESTNLEDAARLLLKTKY